MRRSRLVSTFLVSWLMRCSGLRLYGVVVLFGVRVMIFCLWGGLAYFVLVVMKDYLIIN